VLAIGHLPPDLEDVTKFHALINTNTHYPVLASVVKVLGDWDAKGNLRFFKLTDEVGNSSEQVRSSVKEALVKAASSN
jgi:hypothetical protein